MANQNERMDIKLRFMKGILNGVKAEIKFESQTVAQLMKFYTSLH